MLAVVGAILPLALVVWFSPTRVMAATALLLSGRARAVPGAYAVGWVVGIALYIAVFTIFGAAIGAIQLPSLKGDAWFLDPLVALVMFGSAALAWRARPRPGSEPRPPRLTRMIGRLTPLSALGLGLALSIVSPLHLAVAAAVGVDIATGGLAAAAQLVVVVVFVVLSTSSVTIPVGAAIVAPDRAEAPLRRLQSWLSDHGTALLVVVLLVIGADFVGRWIAALF